jgi:hypothetical protein
LGPILYLGPVYKVNSTAPDVLPMLAAKLREVAGAPAPAAN